MKYFERLHPISAFCYFLWMLLIAMLTMHSFIVTICYLSGILFCGMLIGLRKLLVSLAYSIPMMLMIALTNPLFVLLDGRVAEQERPDKLLSQHGIYARMVKLQTESQKWN